MCKSCACAQGSRSHSTRLTGESVNSETIELEPLVASMASHPVEFDASSFDADFEFEVDAAERMPPGWAV